LICTAWAAPSTRTDSSCSARSSFTWRLAGSSPTSSSSTVPPSARTSSPGSVGVPNSSASRRSSGVAAQLTDRNGLFRRGLALWIARASSSLPVPLSPENSTRASVPATMCACASFSSISTLRVMMSARHSSVVSVKPEIFSARWIWSSSSCLSTGFVRKPNAPICVAWTASGIVP
jgi:hypothetical protein